VGPRGTSGRLGPPCVCMRENVSRRSGIRPRCGLSVTAAPLPPAQYLQQPHAECRLVQSRAPSLWRSAGGRRGASTRALRLRSGEWRRGTHRRSSWRGTARLRQRTGYARWPRKATSGLVLAPARKCSSQGATASPRLAVHACLRRRRQTHALCDRGWWQAPRMKRTAACCVQSPGASRH